MKIHAAAVVTLLAASQQVESFTTPASTKVSFHRTGLAANRPNPIAIINRPLQSNTIRGTSHLFTQNTPEEQTAQDEEIDRLKSMAQKLRAEAAALEAERAQELAEAAESAFRKFDTNKDGEISLEELKAGLEKVLKTELPDNRVQKLMDDFDVSGDGKLQLDEFVGVDRFRQRLESLARDEREQALDAQKAAQQAEEMAKMLEARMNMLNDGAPTTKDKILSVLPYLFPLLDSLQFGRFIVAENSDNPFIIALALMYTLFKSIPFSGFLAFLALNVLSANPGLNRLIRFNMNQAIFLDIALFFPGLFGAIIALIAGQTGNPLPPSVVETGTDVVFGLLVVSVLYASVSSLLGITPNKIPIISNAVENRMPTIDMFDEQGRFVPREVREEKKEGDDDNDQEKKE